MGCSPEQIDTIEQLLQHRNAGISGRKVRVVGKGDRQRTWGTWGKLIQIRDARNGVRNTGGKLTADIATSPSTNKGRGNDPTSKTAAFQRGSRPIGSARDLPTQPFRRLPTAALGALMTPMPELTAPTRQQKIPLAEMRSSDVRGLLVYCANYRCAHAVRISADRWPDHIRLSDLEPLFVCQACGQRGADIRPDWDWDAVQKASRA
jgi:hypothetical protein